MDGVPMRLMVNPDAKPVAHHTPVPVPLHWQADVKAGLDHDVSLGVIEPVPVGEPVTWCHRMVICAKKNGTPRGTVDFQALNLHATRETHHTQSPFHQARTVPNNKKKTVFDCWNGYHSIQLHEDDYHLTTFITPWGRYRYKTAPQGYIASGDGYSRRFDEIVSHVPNKTKCIDDTLLWADNLSESFTQTGWTSADTTASPSIETSLYSELTPSSLQDSRLPQKACVHAKSTSMQSANSRHQPTLPTCVLGSASSIKCHTPSQQQTECYRSASHSSLEHHSTGTTHSISSSKNPKQRS